VFFKRSNRPAGLPEEGRREKVDPTPIAKPVGFVRPPTLQESIQRAMRAHFEQIARENEVESFEDAEDFDVDDDPELKSPYEVDEELPAWKEKDQKSAAVKHAEEKLQKLAPPSKAKPANGGPSESTSGAGDGAS
jgi:hypothetical protein